MTGRLGTRIRASDVGDHAHVEQLVTLLRDGTLTRSAVEASCDAPVDWTSATIDRLWRMGVLVEPQA